MARRHPLIILCMIGAFLCLSLLPAHLHVYHPGPGHAHAAEHGVHAHFSLDSTEHGHEHRHVIDLDQNTLAKKLMDPLAPAALLLALFLLLPRLWSRPVRFPVQSHAPPHSHPADLIPPLRAPPRS
ncbi:hypothetical protein [Thiohalobacter thiocyanaticus]|nr:hypothetical protein [Thiohalobacter thiocyanaticus]